MNFEMQLVTTTRCNLECSYCYMHTSTPEDMSKDVFNAHYRMLPSIMKIYNCDTFTTALFGGEPTLNWRLIEHITPILRNDPKCKKIMLMTNGLPLKDEYKRKFLGDNEIGTSLSFDGIGNDIDRLDSIGHGGTLDEYLEEPLKSYFFNRNSGGTCKVMISPTSAPYMIENYKWFLDHNMSFPDFTIVRDDIWFNDDVDYFEEYAEDLANEVINQIKQGKKTMVGFFQLYILDMIYGAAHGKRQHGCFAGNHGCGFMPSGKIYPCSRFGINDEYSLFNSLNENINTVNVGKFLNPIVSNPQEYEKCKECSLYKYCNAGCTYQQLVEESNELWCKPVENVCNLLHILYKQSIRIVHELKDNELFKEILTNSIKGVG